jgi:hypothetical protein
MADSWVRTPILTLCVRIGILTHDPASRERNQPGTAGRVGTESEVERGIPDVQPVRAFAPVRTECPPPALVLSLRRGPAEGRDPPIRPPFSDDATGSGRALRPGSHSRHTGRHLSRDPGASHPSEEYDTAAACQPQRGAPCSNRDRESSPPGGWSHPVKRRPDSPPRRPPVVCPTRSLQQPAEATGRRVRGPASGEGIGGEAPLINPAEKIGR